jgi:hypothetical protein
MSIGFGQESCPNLQPIYSHPFSQTKESIAEGQRIDMQPSRVLLAVLLLAVVHCGQAELVLNLLNQTLVNSSGARW